eukprot:jgi/Ulvmu1/11831/UM080_0042.1
MVLHLPDDISGHACAVKVLLAKCPSGGPKVNNRSKDLKLESDGTSLTQVNAICKAIARQSCPDLIGSSASDSAQVEQWMSFVHTRFTPVTDEALVELNEVLAKRVFIVNNRLSLADICLYAALSDAVVAFPVAQQSTFCHILRWYDHIHHSVDAPSSSPPICPVVSLPPAAAPKVPSQPAPPAAKRRPDSSATSTAAAASSAVSTGGKKDSAAKKDSAPAADAGSSKADAPVEGMSKKAAKKAAKGGGDRAAASAGSADDAAAAKKAERAAKNAAKNAPAPAAATGPPSVDALDIRVGTITSVQKHPDADALYQEEIDVGEAAPRQIVSGLVKWVPQEEMQGRRVAVLVNLKPAKMRGVTSYGMVLCASSDSAVEPLAVPEGVPNGERVMVDGFAADPEAQLNPKKKVLEALLPDMATSADGVACFKGTPFSTSKGPLSSKIASAPVK